MDVKGLFDKYCYKIKENEYECHSTIIKLIPATPKELEGFKALCSEHGVEQRIEDELADFYSQCHSLFNYFVCNDSAIFDWWQSPTQRKIWMAAIDDICFIYDDVSKKYAYGYAGGKEFGEFDTLEELLTDYIRND